MNNFQILKTNKHDKTNIYTYKLKIFLPSPCKIPALIEI